LGNALHQQRNLIADRGFYDKLEAAAGRVTPGGRCPGFDPKYLNSQDPFTVPCRRVLWLIENHALDIDWVDVAKLS